MGKEADRIQKIRIARWLPISGLIVFSFLFYTALSSVYARFFLGEENSVIRNANALAVLALFLFQPGVFILWPPLAILKGWVFQTDGSKVKILSNSKGLQTFQTDDVENVEYLHANEASLLPNQLNASSAVRFTLKNGKNYSINILFPKDNFSDIAELIEETFKDKVFQTLVKKFR